jgi:hypothetical protein
MFRPIRMDHTNCLQVAIKTLQFNSMDQKALVVLVDKIVRITRERGYCLLLGWTIQAEPSPVGTSAFTRATSRWDGVNSLTPLTLPSATAWVKREGETHPSTVLLRATSTVILDSTIRGCMTKVGTLLMTPEGDLDEIIHKLRPQNPLGIQDLRQTNIDWDTPDNAFKDIQSWVTEEMSARKKLNTSQTRANVLRTEMEIPWNQTSWTTICA